MKRIKNRLKRYWIAVLVVPLFCCVAFISVRDELFLISKNLDIFSAVYRQVNLNYVDKVDAGRLVKAAVDAMLDELDPYTEYVQDTDVADYRLKYVDTRYGGIGLSVFARDNGFFISEIYAGQPADAAGLEAGDELMAVNGEVLEGLTVDKVSHLLRGADGSTVQVQIRRAMSGQLDTVTLTRKMIRQPNVSYTAVLEGGVGYIKLDKFLEQSAWEVEQALDSLQRTGQLHGLVLDLRDNGGGILQESVKIVNLFVPAGELVVSQRGRNMTKNRNYHTMANPLLPDIPLVVLINGRSASAAEIVAGALQDLDRAVIVGERSFGKGLVQQTISIPYNNLVKVTIARYYTPSGRCIQAVDFHKRREGQYTHVPDSTLRAFHTRKDRVVYDGSGIYPDIVVAHGEDRGLIDDLGARYLMFDYATLFKGAHPEIEDATRFEITDAQYADFTQFLKQRNFVGTERLAIEDCREKIKVSLGAEIVSRYYYQSGEKAFTMQHDRELKQAVSLLRADHTPYYSILSGKGEYKTIGEPGTVLAVTP